MMKIAVIDADLIGRKRHRFPNLCCMKISGYYKARGENVTLKLDYDGLAAFDKVYVAKVFTDTPTPNNKLFGDPLDAPNVIKGGTGFYYDKAEPLPSQIEHAPPDYHLYDGICEHESYKDYSIGYLTRGCFRHCAFCVNRRKNKVVAASPLKEFFDPSRKIICLLDDNFFGYENWRDLLIELQNTDKRFMFKQGLDIRLLDEERAELLFASRYYGDYIFAFDDIKEAALIESKIQLMSRYINPHKKRVKFYVFCGYDRSGRYDAEFWQRDLNELMQRIDLLKSYGCLAYTMRHKNYQLAPEPRIYKRIAEWTNQPQFFIKTTFAEYILFSNDYRARRKICGEIT